MRSANSDEDEVAYGCEDYIDSSQPKGKKRPTRAIIYKAESDSGGEEAPQEEVKSEKPKTALVN